MAIGDSGIGGSGLSFEVGIGSGGISKVWETIPVITAGPVWTNNQDGTATVTWTTDIATDSEVNYGPTSSYGSTAEDAAEVTDHSITITGLADDVYHFSVGDIDATYASADALGAVTSALIGHVYIPPHFNIATSASKWFMVSNQDGTANGTAWGLRPVTVPLGGSLHAIFGTFEGAMYPGVVFNYAPDVISGVVSDTTSGNFRFRNIGTSGAYLQWTVPSWVSAANGMTGGLLNSLYVFCNGAGSGAFNVIRTRSGVDATIVSAQTPAGTGFFGTLCSLSAGNELQAGDTFRIVSSGGTASIIGAVSAFSSTGTFPNGVAHRVMNNTMQTQMLQYYGTSAAGTSAVWINGSSTENAWEIAPNGSPPRFIGGAAHQGPTGTFGQESPFTETWVKDGVTWTPSQNYWRAKIALTRVSTCYYDVSNTDIGEMTTVYTALSNDFKVDSQIEYNVALDTGSLYTPMMPVKAFTHAANTLDGTSTETAAIGTLPKTWASQANAVTWAYGNQIVKGIGVYATAGSGSAVYDNRYETQPKNYQRLVPLTATNATIGTLKRGIGRYFSLPAAGPVAPTISATSCTVGSDGRTILIVPVTTTGGITGNTGLTFNVGGSPILLDSTTNNGDGTITCVVSVADTIASADVVTVDVATASLYDAYGIMMAAASGIAVVNESAQR